MIRTLVTSVVFTLMIISASAQTVQEVKWLTWNEGYPKAQKQDKILLVDMYTDWCGWCKKMDKDTYAQKEIVDLIDKYFIPVKFNPEKTDIVYELEGKTYNGRQLMAMLVQNQMTGYPTTVFLFVKDKKVYLQPGYQGPVQFKEILTKYVNQLTTK